jgi:oxygen-dependent protoporphyrinogen oxidase
MKKIVILGAGISGLTLLWYLTQKFGNAYEYLLLEKSSQSGGWIKTIHTGNFTFDLGCRSCRTSGMGIKTLELVESMGLQNEIIFANPDAKKRYIYINQKLECVPNGIWSFLKSPLTQGMTKAIFKDFFFNATSKNDDESIHEFISRRLSKEIAENLFDPLTSGIYAGDIKKLSLKSCFPLLAHYEKTFGSIIKGMIFNKSEKREISPFTKKAKAKKIFSFKKGMQTLTNALALRLDEHISYDIKIKALEFERATTRVILDGGTTIVADHLFSTIPAHHLSELIAEPGLKKALINFESSSIATVSLGFKNSVLKERGFGYLIPSNEKEQVLGVVFDSAVFKEHNSSKTETRITVMLGGAHFKEFNKYTSQDFLSLAVKAVSKHLNINESPDFHHVECFLNAIPQYSVGHSNRVLEVERLSPPHFKALGSSFYGVSVNDCVGYAKHMVDQKDNFIAKKIGQEEN